MSGGKSNKQGTPQGGVIRPLLAIYMNRFLKFWRMRGCGLPRPPGQLRRRLRHPQSV